MSRVRCGLDQGVDVRASDASATEGLDGWGAMCSGLGNLILATAEEAESRFPVLNVSRELVTDTGGPGRWRGQAGSCNVKQVLAPVNTASWMVSQRHPLRGLRGGDDASPYSNRFLVGTPDEYEVEGSVQAQLPEGAVIAYQYGGGAGFESALKRDPAAVLEDVRDEVVSRGAASEHYGVVFRGELGDLTLEVDEPATQAQRASLLSNRESGG